MTIDEVRSFIDPVLARHAVYAVDVGLCGERNCQVVEVFIDSEAGVTSDTCTKVSKDISKVLEKNNVSKGNYHLVVSSPGIDRPLKLPHQYRRNIGKKLYVTFYDQKEQRTIEGTLITCSDQSILLRTKTESSLNLPYDVIVEARVSLPW